MESVDISALKRGDQRSIKVLYDQLFPPLTSFGYKYTKSIPEAEDLVQEAFLSFYESRENFDHPDSIKSFLYTSVKNKCLNRLKHLAVVDKHQQNLIAELEDESRYGNNIIQEETFNRLYQEIKNLPDGAQKIILLSLNGLKNKEIAEKLGVSENTVKTQKKIAYSKLKKKVDPGFLSLILCL